MTHTGLVVIVATGVSLLGTQAVAQHRHASHFVPHDVATGLTGGSQIEPADLNGDSRIDLLVMASGMREVVWFENPSWARHVMTSGITGMENADVFDVDGDGIPAVGIVYGFSQSPAMSSGGVVILTSRGDPSQPWERTEIDRSPTSHRIRWADIDGSGRKVFVNAPFVGPNSFAPDFRDAAPLVYYRPGDWRRQMISSSFGIVHGLYPYDWHGHGRDTLVIASFESIRLNGYVDGIGQRTLLVPGDPAPWPKGGASDFTILQPGEAERMFATIEPWHGNKLAVYRMEDGAWARHVIDETLTLGHTVHGADLDRHGRQALVVADRGDNRSVYLYSAVDSEGLAWEKEVLDDSLQPSWCSTADLTADTQRDIVRTGRAEGGTLRWYENTASRN